MFHTPEYRYPEHKERQRYQSQGRTLKMEKPRLCSDCYLQLRMQLTTVHSSLVEIAHIHNDTLYECSACKYSMRLTHVPHEWNVIGCDAEEASELA